MTGIVNMVIAFVISYVNVIIRFEEYFSKANYLKVKASQKMLQFFVIDPDSWKFPIMSVVQRVWLGLLQLIMLDWNYCFFFSNCF